MNKYIVTGGAGFIGSNIVKGLNNKGCTDILIVDRLGKSEKWKNLAGLKFSDYLDKDDFYSKLDLINWENTEFIYHLGACSSTTEINADYLVYNNYRYTKRLCEISVEKGIRFVYASSAATYGDGSMGYSDDPELIQSLRPLNMYGYSKQMFDEWAYKNNLLNTIAGIKYFNVYGPGEAHKNDMRSMVHKAYEQIINTGRVKLFKSYRPEFKDGEQVRDFLFVDDAVRLTLWFGENIDKNGIFNCGTSCLRTWIDLVNSVFSAMNKSPEIDFIEMPDYLKDKYQYKTCADLSRLREIGYNCQFTSLEKGVEITVKSLLNRV